MLYVYCDRPSASANALKSRILALGTAARRLYGLRVPKKAGLVINWGSPRYNLDQKLFPALNPPNLVDLAASKIETFKRLYEQEIPCVRISLDKTRADKWLKSGHKVLYRRDRLSGGRGIQVYDGSQQTGPGYFYSRVFGKTHEFRVHVCRGKAIDLTQKKSTRRPHEQTEADRLIRTHERGWVFAHDGIILTKDDQTKINQLAVDACEALGLDFGAVDILVNLGKIEVVPPANRRIVNAVVCEINTRPGLENTRTIDAYANAFISPGKPALAKTVIA